MRHPRAMSVDDCRSVVTPGGAGADACNDRPSMTVTPAGTWICCWTRGGQETSADRRLVCARSKDEGRTWGPPIAIEPAGFEDAAPACGVPFTVPHTGRVYVFYWRQVDGDVCFRSSDDDGCSWSGRRRVGLERRAIDDPEGGLCGWLASAPQIMPDASVMLTHTRVRASSMRADDGRTPAEPDQWATEVFFLSSPNLLVEPDVAKLRFVTVPEASGLWVRHYRTGKHFGQEATLVPLGDGRLLAVFRTRLGMPFWSASPDIDRAWTQPEVLRHAPDGPPIQQPCAPCPITRLTDGRLVLLFYNNPGDEGGWRPRHPLWVTVGRELGPGTGNAGLVFTRPRIFLHSRGAPAEIGHPSLFEWAGRVFVVYSHRLTDIRLSEVPPELLTDFGLPR